MFSILTLEASRKGEESNGPKCHDQLPKALAQLFLDNEYMFWHKLNDVIIDDLIRESDESWIFIKLL